jgi:hypothetical protein
VKVTVFERGTAAAALRSVPGAGYAPICYKGEITGEMVSEWRGRGKG